MAMLRLLSGLALVALLALPLAAAAPAEGRLQVEGALALGGPATLDAAAGDLMWAREGVPDLVVQATGVHLERRGTNHTTHALPLVPGVRVDDSDVADRVDHAEATLTLRAGEGDQLVVVRGQGPTQVRAPAFDVRAVEAATLFRAANSEGDRCRSERCAAATAVFEAAAPSSDATFDGPLRLYLRGPTLLVSTPEGDHEYASGVTTRTSGPLTIVEDTWILVTVETASATLVADGPATWYSSAPRFDAPALAARESTGLLEVGVRSYRAHGEALDATGALVVVPQPFQGAGGYAGEGEVVYGQAFDATVEGDVAAINLRAAPVFADTPKEQMGLLAALGAATALLVYYWPHVAFHATSAALPFYTRLKRPEILENDVRNAIYAIIRASPGISARAVQRQSELSWGTVVYHLRQLERHHLVVSRALGRTRNYYENHGKYKGMEVQLACLQSPRALVLARLILQQPGMTQETLAQSSGFPQPTTSYYVRKLKQASLVEEQREGRYARYVPGVELGRYVGLADAASKTDEDAVPAGA